jgi:cytochrome c553
MVMHGYVWHGTITLLASFDQLIGNLTMGLPGYWGSCRFGKGHVSTGSTVKSMPEPSTERAIVDGGGSTSAKVARAIHCTSCHGDHFEGVDNIGRLAGQREDYLLKALGDFKSNARLATGAAGMAEVVYPRGDPEMRALAHYLSRLP